MIRHLHRLLLAFLLIREAIPVASQTEQRAGLLYERVGHFTVNADTLIIRREAETSILKTAAQQSGNLATLYYTLCNRIYEMVFKPKEDCPISKPKKSYRVSPLRRPLHDANQMFKQMGGILPEPRSQDELLQIAQVAMKAGIWDTLMGVKYHKTKQRFHYISDDTSVPDSLWPKVEYGGEYLDSRYTVDWNNWYAKDYSDKFTIIIKTRLDDNSVSYRFADKGEIARETLILCEIPPTIAKEIDVAKMDLFKLTAHNCLSNVENIMQSTAFIVSEVSMITNLDNLLDPNAQPDFESLFPTLDPQRSNDTGSALAQALRNVQSMDKKMFDKTTKREAGGNGHNSHNDNNIIILSDRFHTSRVKRHLPNLDTSLSELLEDVKIEVDDSPAPLGFVGDLMGSLFGLVTRKTAVDANKLVKMSKAMTSLSVNQRILASAVNNLIPRVDYLESQISKVSEGTTISMMEQDLRNQVRHSHTLIQLTLAKYANIITAAQTGGTSPYALSVKELEQIGQALPKGRWIVPDLARVETKAAIIGKRLTLLFSVPIVTDTDTYEIFRITPTTTN